MREQEFEIVVSGRVAAPMLESVHLAGEIIALCSRAIDSHAFDAPMTVGSGMTGLLTLQPPDDITEHKRRLKCRVLAQVFHELARGIRQTLEEAYIFCVVAEHVGHRLNFPETLRKARKAANKADTTSLINAVSKRMIEPLGIEAELRSIHKVRNCMEHRFGIVGEKDLEPEENKLVLTLPRWGVFAALPDGESVELTPGVANDCKVVASISARRTTRSTVYELGESISFDESEIGELLFACQIIASDIEYRLPYSGHELVGTRPSAGSVQRD